MNTIATLGEEATLKALIQNQLTEFEDDRVRKLGIMAFAKRANLREIVLPSVLELSGQAFYYCDQLEKVDLGSSYGTGEQTGIRSSAFEQCPNLKAVLIRNTSNVVDISSTNFANSMIARLQGAIYVPRSLLPQYYAAFGDVSTAHATWLNGSFFALEDYPLETIPDTLDLTWTQIKAKIEDGSFFTGPYYHGMCKTLTYGNKTVRAQIMRIDSTNHYVDFITRTYAETAAFNDVDEPVVFGDSLLKQRLDTIYNSELPSELKSVITSVTQQYISGYNNGSYQQITAPLWPLSAKALGINFSSFNPNNESIGREQVFNGTGQIMTYTGENTSADVNRFWLGTSVPYNNGAKYIYYGISRSGSLFTSQDPRTLGGVVFCFRIAQTV